MKIIVQAGGLGTRMKALTASKPKALVAVLNKPILFHLFDAFPEDEFIVIGDYKYDVLDRYLTTFASKRNCLLVKARGKGNCAGLAEAVSYVPEGEPFVIVWSDLILPKGFALPKDFSGCLVGTVDFACSWGFTDGAMRKAPVEKSGVAGFYAFSDKKLLAGLPEEGSFTTWLASQQMHMSELRLEGCLDVGTLQAFNQLDNSKYRCRPYNHIEIRDDVVVKTGLTEEAVRFIEREVEWYSMMESFGFKEMPRLVMNKPMTLSCIHGQNLFLCSLDADGKRATLSRVMEALSRLHSYAERPSDCSDLYREYFGKTMERLATVASAVPFGNARTIRINNRECLNILREPEVFRRAVLNTLMKTRYTPFHGDCQLTNTLLDEGGRVYFIDPRGYFGKSHIFGDPRYDWAKVYYAIKGNFDQFNVKNFTFDLLEDEVTFSIASGGWEFLTEEFFQLLPGSEGNRKEIELIHAVIWLSMASHVWEDYDSMCVAFMNGILLFNEWMEKYSHAA